MSKQMPTFDSLMNPLLDALLALGGSGSIDEIYDLYFSFYIYCDISNATMGSKAKFRPNPKLKLMEQVREVLRYHHYAYKTEQAYCRWIGRYVRFFGSKMHPCDLGPRDVERFLSDLAAGGQGVGVYPASGSQRHSISLPAGAGQTARRQNSAYPRKEASHTSNGSRA